MANGYVLYAGPSQYDGVDIVAILTLRSVNGKTGDIPQVWIMRQDVKPNAALTSGDDTSVCGACPLRGKASGGNGKCYVRTFQGPRSIWQAWSEGKYADARTDSAGLKVALAGRTVRIGAYGDPVAVPYSVWTSLAGMTGKLLGYSHGWTRVSPDWNRYVMASADDVAGRAAARALGYRTFRVAAIGESRQTGEVSCPASKEAGYRTTCAVCKACDGTQTGRRQDIVIQIH